MVRKLEAAPVGTTVPLPAAYGRLRDVAMHRLGVGTIREMHSIVTGLLVGSFRNPEYTLAEKVRMWRGKIYSGNHLWNAELDTDLRTEVPEVRVPVYLVHGVHDYTVSYPLARAYFDGLKAPVKGFYTFQDSAHSPFFEEPEKFREIMRHDVLAQSTDLADPASATVSTTEGATR